MLILHNKESAWLLDIFMGGDEIDSLTMTAALGSGRPLLCEISVSLRILKSTLLFAQECSEVIVEVLFFRASLKLLGALPTTSAALCSWWDGMTSLIFGPPPPPLLTMQCAFLFPLFFFCHATLLLLGSLIYLPYTTTIFMSLH